MPVRSNARPRRHGHSRLTMEAAAGAIDAGKRLCSSSGARRDPARAPVAELRQFAHGLAVAGGDLKACHLHRAAQPLINAPRDAGNSDAFEAIFPAAIFLSLSLAGLVTAWVAYVGVKDAARLKFEATADDALGRIESSIDLNLSLLTATQAFFMTHDVAVRRPGSTSITVR